jgi:hypothetical protein
LCCRAWYRVDARNRTIIEETKIAEEAIPAPRFPVFAARKISGAAPAMARAAPRPWSTALAVSSPGV